MMMVQSLNFDRKILNSRLLYLRCSASYAAGKKRHMLTKAPSTDGESGSAALEQRIRYEIAAVVANHGVPPNLILLQILFDALV